MFDWRWSMMVGLFTGLGLCLAMWPLRQQRWAIVWAPILLVLSGLAYWHWGAWPAEMAFRRQQAQQQRAQAVFQSIKGGASELRQTLKTHLAAHPKSARGWYLLGRLAASQQLWDESLHAFENAYRIKPADEAVAVNYAQGLFARHQGTDEARARQVLVAVLQHNPAQLDALAMLAIDAQHHHKLQAALYYWQRLLPLLPPQSEEAAAIRKAILQLRGQMR